MAQRVIWMWVCLGVLTSAGLTQPSITIDAGRPGAKIKALNVSTTLDQDAGEVILKVVNVSPEVQTTTVTLNGVTQAGPSAQVILLTSGRLTDENSLADPKKISPKTMSMRINSLKFTTSFKPYSMTIIRVPVK
jgi:alpha-N-arabinofuranosidase